MRFLKRIITMNFWYEVSLNCSIWNTLKKTNQFNQCEIKQIKKRYIQLKKSNRTFIKDIQSEYHVSWSSIVLAIYEAFKKKCMDKEIAINMAEHVIFLNMKPDIIASYIKTVLDKAKDPFLYMVKSSKNQESNFFGSTFQFYRPVENINSYHLRVSDCIYNNYFQKNGTQELMRIACKWDMISWSKGIVPIQHGLVFKRSVTLGIDNKDCEFDFDRTN